MSLYDPRGPFALVLGEDGRLHRKDEPETLESPPDDADYLPDPLGLDDDTYSALVAINRARLAELRCRRFPGPDLSTFVSDRASVAFAVLFAAALIARVVVAGRLPHSYLNQRGFGLVAGLATGAVLALLLLVKGAWDRASGLRPLRGRPAGRGRAAPRR